MFIVNLAMGNLPSRIVGTYPFRRFRDCVGDQVKFSISRVWVIVWCSDIVSTLKTTQWKAKAVCEAL